MEKEIFKPKMRVTLISKNGCPISDRLVDAFTELNMGPKVQHSDPIRLEITLENQSDIQRFKEYLDKLTGALPIKVSAGIGRPAATQTKELESPREDILLEVEKMVESGKNQSDIIKYLRELGFVFILTEDLLYHFKGFPFDKKDVGEPNQNGQYPNSFSWLIRRVKKAKDPKADKFDPMIMFGISIINGTSKKVVPYLYKERRKPMRIETGKNILSFSKTEFTKMPAFMLEEERLKFSTEQRQLIINQDKKPSKFFQRWSRDVLLPPFAYEKLKGREGLIFKNDLES
jgi:hypothetical protein